MLKEGMEYEVSLSSWYKGLFWLSTVVYLTGSVTTNLKSWKEHLFYSTYSDELNIVEKDNTVFQPFEQQFIDLYNTVEYWQTNIDPKKGRCHNSKNNSMGNLVQDPKFFLDIAIDWIKIFI